MEEPNTIVANWTHREGNYLCASSKDNVPVVERLGRTGGLANDQAATLRNHCSVVKCLHTNAVCGGERVGRAYPLKAKAIFLCKFGHGHTGDTPA